ncbi:hypothetical protein MANES_15G193101v8, partial [Manihot esculenta]
PLLFHICFSLTVLFTTCRFEQETVLHTLVHCPFTRDCWELTAIHQAIMITWEIWNARNRLLWQHQIVNPYTVLLKAKRFQHEWQAAKLAPPPDKGVKCNVDASLDASTGVAGVGMVLRDGAGSFLEARSVSLGCVTSALMAKIMGVREALS